MKTGFGVVVVAVEVVLEAVVVVVSVITGGVGYGVIVVRVTAGLVPAVGSMSFAVDVSVG